jgi:hypothetical protein
MSSSSDPSLQVNQLPISIDFPKDEERFLDTLSLWAKRVGNAVNTKEGSLYSLQEFFNFKQYYTVGDPQTFRNVYRKCFDLVDLNGGNIPAGGTVSFPHGITGLFEGTMIYAGCTSTTPTYFSVMGQPTIYLDSVNINFTNPIGVPLKSVIAVCEYLKN